MNTSHATHQFYLPAEDWIDYLQKKMNHSHNSWQVACKHVALMIKKLASKTIKTNTHHFWPILLNQMTHTRWYWNAKNHEMIHGFGIFCAFPGFSILSILQSVNQYRNFKLYLMSSHTTFLCIIPADIQVQKINTCNKWYHVFPNQQLLNPHL